MGWFDNEQQEGKPAAPSPQSAPSRPVAHNPAPSSPSGSSGSTLGRQIHIDGNIVCEEDLTILGHVEGTLRAKGTLVIAKEADVHAKIDGQRVVIHGKVDGNVQGEERVTLGQTARLSGNIDTPVLEILEGAHFKGSVEMKTAKQAPAKTAPAPAPSPAPSASVKQEVATGDSAKPDKSDKSEKPKGPTPDTTAAGAGAKKQASP